MRLRKRHRAKFHIRGERTHAPDKAFSYANNFDAENFVVVIDWTDPNKPFKASIVNKELLSYPEVLSNSRCLPEDPQEKIL